MEEKYLRHKPLPIDDAARKRVKDLINQYASRSEGHPFGNYGDQIILQKYELCPTYVEHLHSQYDKRPVVNSQYPYKGGQIYTRKYYKPSDVDVWSYGLLTTEKFVHNGEKFEVPGSHHVEPCGRCSGRGRVTCPRCGGTGDQTCSVCNGNGQIKKTRQVYRHTADKVYSDGHREPVYSYVDETYYVTCSNCGGDGRVNCPRCDGNRTIQCEVCEGYGKNVHCFVIAQTLEDKVSSHYFHDPNVAKIQEFTDQYKNYRGQHHFHSRANAMRKGVFTEESELAGVLDSFIGEHSSQTNANCHILFQEADIFRVDVWWVQYTYKGRTYDGCITEAFGDERFIAGVSPITELADKWLKEARKKVGGVGTIKARKMLEQVDKLNVYGRTGVQAGIQARVDTHLNTLYNLSNDLMFWLIALLGTPFIYNFYDSLNPVMRYAHFLNDPAWGPYGWVPVVQCILFLGLLWFAKFYINESDHSKGRHLTVFGFVFTGMGLYLLIAVGILAVLLGLNYLGLPAITAGIFWLAWRVIRLALMILIYVLIIAYGILRWLFGLLVKLWHLIF